MDTTVNPVLYLDCSAGLSGDMAAGAMADLLNDDNTLMKSLAFLNRYGYRAEIGPAVKQGVLCRQFSVLPENLKTSGHGHHHRTLADVREIINEASLTPKAQALAYHVYDIIAEAEAEAHGLPAEEVQFHEVASLPSIADVITFSVCYDRLGILDTVITALFEGTGTVECDHGIIPVPVPAVRNILTHCGLPLAKADAKGEILTPTGAAIAAAVRTSGAVPEKYEVTRNGYGAGTRETGLRGYAAAALLIPRGKEHSADE